MNQHQYSPDMAPSDFSLFSQIRNTLKCKQCENVEMVKQCNAATFRKPRTGNERSSSSGRTNGIYAAKQDGHTSRRISPFKNRFSIVSFTVSVWMLLHLASYTCTHTHTHTQYKIPRDCKSRNYVNLCNSVHCEVFQFLENVLQLFVF